MSQDRIDELEEARGALAMERRLSALKKARQLLAAGGMTLARPVVKSVGKIAKDALGASWNREEE